MKRMNLSNTLSAAALTGGMITAASAQAQPSQGANGPGYGMGPGMMGDYGGYGYGWMGGYGGVWGPLLLIVVVAGLVAWVVKRNRK